jgi:hypothetical protein
MFGNEIATKIALAAYQRLEIMRLYDETWI